MSQYYVAIDLHNICIDYNGITLFVVQLPWTNGQAPIFNDPNLDSAMMQ